MGHGALPNAGRAAEQHLYTCRTWARPAQPTTTRWRQPSTAPIRSCLPRNLYQAGRGRRSAHAILTNPHVRLRTNCALERAFFQGPQDRRDGVRHHHPGGFGAAAHRPLRDAHAAVGGLRPEVRPGYPYTSPASIGRTALDRCVRGAFGTTATAQTAGIVSVYSPRPALLIHKVEFYSTDIDMTLADVAAQIAGKAGVQVVTDEMRETPLAQRRLLPEPGRADRSLRHRKPRRRGISFSPG
jgi:hypothetical protein